MTTAETRQNGLRRLRKFTANPLKSLCEDVLRRLRRFIAKSLIFLAKVCEAKVPHTPYELSQRSSALRSSLQKGSERGRRSSAGWPAPRCPVCHKRIGRRALLDVLDGRRGGRFRLSCRSVDDDHTSGVDGTYSLWAGGNLDAQLRNIAELHWVDPARVAMAAMPWLLAYCRFVGREP